MLLLIFLIWCQFDRWIPSGSMSTCLISGNSCLMSASSLRTMPSSARWLLEVIRGQSEAIRGHQRPSEAIRGHPRPIRGHQRPSKAITPVNLGAQEDAVELVDREEEGLCLDGWLG